MRPAPKTILAAIILTTAGIASAAFSTGVSAAITTAKPQLRFAATVTPSARTHTVTTKIYLNPDSGDNGNNWANDTFTRILTVTRSGGQRGYEYVDGTWKPYPVADCGGGIHCYHYTYTITDTGHAATIAGQLSPDLPATLLDVAENATMTGGTTDGQFYASYKNYYTKFVPATMDENGIPLASASPYATGNFATLGAAQAGAHVAGSSLGANAGWTYTVPAGRDTQCPAYTGTWTDSAANGWGTSAGAGNLLAPDAADCAAQSGTG